MPCYTYLYTHLFVYRHTPFKRKKRLNNLSYYFNIAIKFNNSSSSSLEVWSQETIYSWDKNINIYK